MYDDLLTSVRAPLVIVRMPGPIQLKCKQWSVGLHPVVRDGLHKQL